MSKYIRLLITLAIAACALALTGVDACKNQPTQGGGNGGPDTTSHNFVWQTFTLGGISSDLYDATIISDTDIWVGGELQPVGDTNYSNAAHWDGKNWTLVRVNFDLDFGNGPYITNQVRIKSIFQAAPNDIWFLCGGGVTRYLNGQWQMISVPQKDQYDAFTTWGNSATDFYCVGAAGSIAHWNGQAFTKIPTGTTIPIDDIYGSVNPQTGEQEIYAVGSNGDDTNQARILFRVQGTTATQVSDSGLATNLDCLWFRTGEKYIVGGDGLFFTNSTITNSTIWPPYVLHSITEYYTESIIGQDTADIMTAGNDEVMHYNGRSWYRYTILRNTADYHRVQLKGNTAIAVGLGFSGEYAMVALGKR